MIYTHVGDSPALSRRNQVMIEGELYPKPPSPDEHGNFFIPLRAVESTWGANMRQGVLTIS
jgi:hypothetical protein